MSAQHSISLPLLPTGVPGFDAVLAAAFPSFPST
jgi:hypothetical protein